MIVNLTWLSMKLQLYGLWNEVQFPNVFIQTEKRITVTLNLAKDAQVLSICLLKDETS